MYCYSGTFAGHLLSFCFQYQETATFYGNALLPDSCSDNCVHIPQTVLANWQKQWKVEDPAYAEYVLSCNYACDALMHRDCIVFHGASFLWHDKAWLFTAPSGTGKTTQLRNWETLFGREIAILNGDKPILQLCADGSILVHPSPWKGKEGLGKDDIIAPLGGIILLQQARENHIRRMDPSEAVRLLFGRSYSTFSTKEDVRNAVRIMDGILKASPVWMLQNLGDHASARLMRQRLIEEGL